MLGEYRSNPKKDVELSLFSMVEENKTLSIEDQMFMLTSIPNHHKWLWPGEKFYHLKFEQRFSNCSRYFPGSPRNRIIQACSHRENASEIITSCLNNVIGVESVVKYHVKASGQSGIKNTGSVVQSNTLEFGVSVREVRIRL